MKIVGCGNQEHSQSWYSHEELNAFCGHCGKVVCGKTLPEPKKRVKIVITQIKDHELDVFSCYASYKEDNKMHYIDTFTTPEFAVTRAKVDAIRYHCSGTRFKWEVWLDAPVVRRDVRRCPQWESWKP